MFEKIPGVARGCLDTIPGFFTFPINFGHEAIFILFFIN